MPDNSPRAEVWLAERLTHAGTSFDPPRYVESIFTMESWAQDKLSRLSKMDRFPRRIVRFVEAREGEGGGE